jgi:DinB family protein
VTSPEEVIAQLVRGPALLAGLLGSVPPQDLKRRPRPEKWSAHEHACHVAVMEPMWAARLDRMLREDNPALLSYEPDDEDPDRLLAMDLRAALADYERGRHALVGRLGQLPVEAWLRPATHTAHARYSVFLMCRHLALHDALHGYRIEEIALGSHWPTER